MWIVGQVKDEGKPWEFQGVFDSEERAVAACRDSSYFVGAASLNEEHPHETTPGWLGAYYPLEGR